MARKARTQGEFYLWPEFDEVGVLRGGRRLFVLSWQLDGNHPAVQQLVEDITSSFGRG